MSYSSDLTKERILSCAKAEFMEYGFLKANIRTIANNAKVTTGAMYNHFKNKQVLFQALVGNVAEQFLQLFKEEHSKCEECPSFFEGCLQQTFDSGTYAVLDFIYEHFDEVKLLICHSDGTKYEHFVDELIEVEEKCTLKILKNNEIHLNDSEIFFVHVTSTSSINNMLEAVHHNLKKEDAFPYMKKLQQFHYAGWKEILGR